MRLTTCEWLVRIAIAFTISCSGMHLIPPNSWSITGTTKLVISVTPQHRIVLHVLKFELERFLGQDFWACELFVECCSSSAHCTSIRDGATNLAQSHSARELPRLSQWDFAKTTVHVECQSLSNLDSRPSRHPTAEYSGDESTGRPPPTSSAVFPRPMSRLLPAATRQSSRMTSSIGPSTKTPTSKPKRLKRKAGLPSADQRKNQRIDTTSVAESVVASVLEGAQKLEKFRTHLEARVVLENLKHLKSETQSLEDVEVAYRVDSKKASCRSWWSSLTSAYASEALFGLPGQQRGREGRPSAKCTQSRTDRELRTKCRLERHRERLYARFYIKLLNSLWKQDGIRVKAFNVLACLSGRLLYQPHTPRKLTSCSFVEPITRYEKVYCGRGGFISRDDQLQTSDSRESCVEGYRSLIPL